MLKEGADPIPITYILKEGENTQEVPCNLVFIRDEGTSPNDNAIEINSGKGITMRILHSSLPTLQRDPANLGLEKSIYECRLSDTQAMNFVCEQDVIHWKTRYSQASITDYPASIKKTKKTVPLTEIKFDRSQSSDFKQRLIDIIDGNCNASPEQRYDSNSLAQNGHQKEALNPSDSSENTSSYDEEGSSEVVEDLDKSEIQNEDSSNLPDFEFVNDEQKPQQDVAQSEPIQPKSSNKDDVEFDDEEDEQLFTDSDLSKKSDEILEKMFCNNKDEKGLTNLTNDEISSLLAQIDTDTLEETLSEELEAGMSHMNETQKEEAMMSQDKKSYFLKRLRHEFQDDEDDDEILHKSGQISQRNAISFLTTQREIEESDSGSGSEGNLSMNARVPNPPQHPVPLPEPKRENLAAIIEALTKFRGMDKMIFLNFFSRFGSRYLEALKGIFFPMEADRETNKDDLAKCCQIIVCFIKICDRDLLMLLLRRDNYYLTFGALEYSSKAQLNKVNYRSHVNDPTKYKHLNSLGLQKYRDQAEYLYRLVYLKRILIYHDFDDVLMGFLSSCEIIMSADLIRAITCDKEIFRKLLDIEPIDEENEEEGQQVEDHDVRKAKMKFFMEIMTFLKGIPNPMMKSQVISKVNGENRLINVLMNLLKAPLFNLVEFEERRIKMCQSEDDYKSTHLRTLEICFKPYYEIPVKINELVTLALEVFLGVNALDACSTHKMILTRYSIEKKSTLFEDLGFILLHTRDEIIKEQVYAFMCSIVETIPPFDDCRRIASLFLGTTLFNFFIPYLDQPETIISAHREDYHVTTSIICKLLRMCLNKSREVHVVNRIANTKMMWNLSKLYSYAAKHIKIEVIKLVKFLILTPDEQMGETIIESDILPKIILTLRESAENQGILFCLVSGMIKSMISQNRAKLCKYITHFLFKGNALDDGVMHFMEPLKAVEENNSKLAHDADIGKETTSNTNALTTRTLRSRLKILPIQIYLSTLHYLRQKSRSQNRQEFLKIG
ncbi:unnamed protein product [Moneuplotes crassus]|uniref:Serine/threonine-protein phosphatase 4 regulatory subunit 3-like central domain-containing protein n=1 Tax=Euplotes crassus TaxID=5936 RepID=A0AAD1XR96_EUPCR|nr:unnamed protein product [Moneuplotes crassus]